MALDSLEALQGIIGGAIKFHLDLTSDILYLRLLEQAETPAYSEETDDGYLLVRDLDTDGLIGMTVLGYWERFGRKALPEVSLEELQAMMQAVAGRLSAA
jgi:hypothetical protein